MGILWFSSFLYRYTTSAIVLQEESGMSYNDNTNNYSVLNSLKAKILEGEWEVVETLLKDNIEKE